MSVTRRPLSGRQRSLLALIQERGFVSVGDMAAQFGVSEMTVRRDLHRLEAERGIQRLHGGATSRDKAESEPSFLQRQSERRNEKRAIARAAAALVAPNTTVGIDVGTTTYELARELAGSPRSLNVFTNSLRIGMLLADTSLSVYMPGGRVRGGESSICGSMTLSQLQEFRLDQVFIGVSGLTSEGLFDYSLEDTEVKRAYLRQAAHVVVVADASKFGRVSAVKVCGLNAINTLVTSAEPVGPLRERLQQAEVRIVVALDFESMQTAGG
jgi:DeoR/GlpR family transcriptional regulator of sugar metabolism